MLKSSSPIPQTEEPADGEAGGTGAAPSQGNTAPRGVKVPRRYEVPEADALSELPNRPHAQTVRGQIQRVRLDLLARENERLDHQLRELRQQQNDYQEKDSAWRDGWQKRLVDLSGQVDHLISEAEAAREVEPEKDDGPELRDTVKPLLLAVLEMLDDTDGQGRPARPDAARAAARAASPIAPPEPAPPAAVLPELPQTAPVAPSVFAEPDPAAVAEPAVPAPDQAEAPVSTADATGPGTLADEALPETRPALASIGRMESWDTVPAPPEPDPADAVLPDPDPDPDPEFIPGSAELAESAVAEASIEPATGPEVASGAEETDTSDWAQSFSPGDESADDESAGDDMAIEIARLLLPQGDAGDNTDLLFIPEPEPESKPKPEPETAARKDVTQRAPQAQDDSPDEADQTGETLVLGTDETPKLTLPEPAAGEITKPEAAEANPAEDWQAKPRHRGTGATSHRDTGVTSKFAASGLDRPVARRKPAAGEQPGVGEGPQASGPDSRAKPLHRQPEPRPDPEPEPDVPTEPLPRCLTERWEDADMASSERGQPAQPRDKGSYRWPFRRLRATIEHDHAHADSETEPGAVRRPRGNTRFGQKLE